MRVMFLSYYYLPHAGGGTWSVYYLSRHLALKGNLIRLIVPNVRYSSSFDSASSKLIEVGNPSLLLRTPSFPMPRILGPALSPLFLLVNGLRVKGIDIILCQFHPHHFVLLVGLLLGRILRRPVVARADDIQKEIGTRRPFYAKLMNLVNERFIRFTSEFLVVLPEDVKILGTRSKTSRITVSPNGVDLSELAGISKEDARSYLGIGQKTKLILFVGRSSGLEYRTEALIGAFPIIQEFFPDSVLFFVGDRAPYGLRLDAVNRESFRVLGPTNRNEIRKFLAAADVCVGPLGPTNTMPSKVLEYMASGKPVVTGIRSVADCLALNHFNCVCVPPEPMAVANAILSILEDEEYGRKLGSNARLTAEKFSWADIATDLETVLLTSISRMNGSGPYNGESSPSSEFA